MGCGGLLRIIGWQNRKPLRCQAVRPVLLRPFLRRFPMTLRRAQKQRRFVVTSYCETRSPKAPTASKSCSPDGVLEKLRARRFTVRKGTKSGCVWKRSPTSCSLQHRCCRIHCLQLRTQHALQQRQNQKGRRSHPSRMLPARMRLARAEEGGWLMVLLTGGWGSLC